MLRNVIRLAAALLPALCSAAEPEMSARLVPDSPNGIRLFYGKREISKSGRLNIVAPGWKRVYVRSGTFFGRQKVEFEKLPNGGCERIAALDGTATIDEYSVRCQGNSAVITAAATMRKDLPGRAEHVAMVLNNLLLENAEYVITLPDGSQRSGVIPEPERTTLETALLPEFVRGEFRSNAIRITIEVLEGPPVKLNDRRTAQYSGFAKCYILWVGEAKLPEAGKTWRQQIRVSCAPPVPAPPEKFSAAIPRSAAGEIGLRRPAPPPELPLLPTPRKCRFTGTGYNVEQGDCLMISGASEKLLRHARKFAKRWGLGFASDGEIGCEMRGICIFVGDDPADESYTLVIGSDGGSVNAKGERGAFYALQTLNGLRRNGGFRGAVIEDAPAFPIRAVHANADSDALKHLGKLSEKLFAPLKINTIILECPFVKWDALKGQHRAQGMSKEDLEKLLRIAEENYLKVYPLVPTYSHSEWFFWNDKDLEMLDNPKDRRSYNSLHPGVRPKLTGLFTEVLEAFHRPEYFHISHDELFGEHPVRPEGKKAGLAKLFYDDTMWHYEFFKKRGVKLMMWHDMLVSKAETDPASQANGRNGTELLRKKLPRDITICMWNYRDRLNGRYPEVDRFREDGYPVIGAGWFYPGNLEALSAYCKKHGAVGMIETTWHNKVGSGGLLHTQYPQLTAYVRAAALFWSPDKPVPADPATVFSELMNEPDDSPGMLSAVRLRGNLALTGSGDDFGKLPDRVATPNGVVFRLARKDSKIAAASVKSARHPDLPPKVRIPIKGRCRTLHLLHTVLNKTLRKDGVTVKLVLRYADGSFARIYPRSAIDISYGPVPVFKDDGQVAAKIFEVATPRENFSFLRNHRNVIEWTNRGGEPRRLWAMSWANPHPAKKIDHLLIEAREPGCVYALLALTLESDVPRKID